MTCSLTLVLSGLREQAEPPVHTSAESWTAYFYGNFMKDSFILRVLLVLHRSILKPWFSLLTMLPHIPIPISCPI